MFEPTIPFGEPELIRVSDFRRYLDELDGTAVQGAQSRLAALSPSLLADLMRFEQQGEGSETLEVLAACLRHSRNVTVHLSHGDKVVPLTIFPQQRLAHSPIDTGVLLESRLTELRVLHVEPALLRPPGDPESKLIGEANEHYPLGHLLWELALRGHRDTLLPEIAGPAAYRVSPGLDLGGLRITGALLAAISRLRRETTTLREMADWPGFDRRRAARLLNAIYLQAGLIVSRTHRSAFSESWFGALAGLGGR